MSSDSARAGDLVLRFAALMLVTAAILFGLIAAAMLLLDKTVVEGSVRYLLPGSRATLDSRIVMVLAGCAAVAGLPGLALLLVPGAVPVGRIRPVARSAVRTRRPYIVLAGGLLILVVAILIRRLG